VQLDEKWSFVGRADVALLGDGLGHYLAGGHLQLEAVDVAGRLGRLRGVHQLELVPHRVLDQDNAVLRVAVLHRVGLLLAQLRRRVEGALDGLDVGQPAAVGVDLRLDLRAEAYGVGDEPPLVGLQVRGACVAGVGAALEDGERPLHQVQPRRVLQLQAQRRELRRPSAGVVPGR
jgi:hypothetical protein